LEIEEDIMPYKDKEQFSLWYRYKNIVEMSGSLNLKRTVVIEVEKGCNW